MLFCRTGVVVPGPVFLHNVRTAFMVRNTRLFEDDAVGLVVGDDDNRLSLVMTTIVLTLVQKQDQHYEAAAAPQTRDDLLINSS